MYSEKLEGAKSMSMGISRSSVEEAEEDHRVEYIGKIEPCTIIFGASFNGRATKIVLEEEARVWGQPETREKLTSDHAVYIKVENGKVLKLRNEPHDITYDRELVQNWEGGFGDLPEHDYLITHN